MVGRTNSRGSIGPEIVPAGCSWPGASGGSIARSAAPRLSEGVGVRPGPKAVSSGLSVKPSRSAHCASRRRHTVHPVEGPVTTRRRSTRASGAVAWPRSRSPKGRRGGTARADHDRQPEDTEIDAVRGDVTLPAAVPGQPIKPASARCRIIARIRGGRHADLPAPAAPGAHEVTAATALTSRSAPGTASPATRAATTGGAAPANSAAATG